MADAEGELPMFIEEEEAEAAAARAERERRREGGRWGLDKIRAKFRARYAEMAREHEASAAAAAAAAAEKEEESAAGPMRHLQVGLGGPELASSVNIISVKVVRSTLRYPIDLYGTVFVRDELDCKRICVFRRDRRNCQRINSKDELLSLTGPYRGLLVFNNIYFEIDLKCKGLRAAKDIELGQWFLKDNTLTSTSKPIRNRFVGKLCAVDLTYVPVHRAVEVIVEVKILQILRIREKPNGLTVEDWLPFNKKRKEHSEFHGSVTTCIDGIPEVVLCDSVITVGDGGLLQLSRCVLSVPIDRMVLCKIVSSDDHWVVDCYPSVGGCSSLERIVGSYKLELKLVWSALYSPKEDGLPQCMVHYL
ncbi:hypothetical protein ACP4OV_019377 [Aristida adscensionis]